MSGPSESIILFVCQAANLYGSERTMLTLLENDFPPGFKPIVMCPPQGPLCDRLDQLGIERIPCEFNKVSLRRGPQWHWAFFRRTVRLLKRIQSKAVVIVYEGNVPLLVAAARFCRVPVYRILQIAKRPACGKFRARFLTDRSAFRWCNGVFCGSKVLREQLRSNYCLPRQPPTAVVYLPVRSEDVPLADTRYWRNQLHIPPEASVVGQFSRMHPVKGIEITLAAAKSVIDRNPSTWFVVCGGVDGSRDSQEYEAKLRHLVATLGIQDRIVFPGFIDDVLAAMQACDIVVLPSYSEGLPISCLEAMLVQRPIVGSNIDGMGEVITESRCGFTIEPGDHESLATHISTLLNDKAMRERMGQNGRGWILEHSSPSVYCRRFWEAFANFSAQKTALDHHNQFGRDPCRAHL